MLQMAYMWRYNPAVAEMLRLVGSGSLGQVFMYRGHIPKPINWHKQLYGEFTAYHGGVYFEMAGHLGGFDGGDDGRASSRPRRCWASTTESGPKSITQWSSTSVAMESASSIRPPCRSAWTRRIEVHGTQGTILHEPIGSNKLRVFLAQETEGYQAGEWQDVELGPGPAPPSLLRELAACIRGEKTPDFALAHDRAVQRTLFKGCGITDGHALRT